MVFSIIGIMGVIGAIFAFIGGISAIVYNPTPAPYAAAQQPYYGPPPQPAAYQPPQMHVCPQCGTQLQANARFCPNYGKQQY